MNNRLDRSPGLPAEDYQALFHGIESTLVSEGSRRLPADEIRAYLDGYKHLEGESFSDDDYYWVLVQVVFYAGFRAATVASKLAVIREHFPDYKAVAAFDGQRSESIISDPRMIRNRRKVAACIANARALTEIAGGFGSFKKYLDSFRAAESSPRLAQLRHDLGRRFEGLGPINVYHFLMDIGMPVLKPDLVVSRTFKRLGLVEGETPDSDEVVREGTKFAAATGLPIRYVDIVFVHYGQVKSEEVGLEQGICLRVPRCEVCGVTKYCHYYEETAARHGTRTEA
jgi:DNA-3-methyladenine glycosylase I